MKEYAKMKLWEVCLDKPLFRKELQNLVNRTNQHDIFEVLKYCYDKYSDMHADILLEVFSNYGKKPIEAVQLEKNEPVEMWN